MYMDRRIRILVYAFCGFMHSTVVRTRPWFLNIRIIHKLCLNMGLQKWGVKKFLFPVYKHFKNRYSYIVYACKLLITKPCPQQDSFIYWVPD